MINISVMIRKTITDHLKISPMIGLLFCLDNVSILAHQIKFFSNEKKITEINGDIILICNVAIEKIQEFVPVKNRNNYVQIFKNIKTKIQKEEDVYDYCLLEKQKLV